jgi:PAS domain S-box-containing protein
MDIEAASSPGMNIESAFRRVQSMASIGCWQLDLTDLADINSNRLEWSDGLFAIFGYVPRSVPVTNALFFEAVHPDDRAAIGAAVSDALRTRKPYDIEHRITRPDGAVRWVLEHADVISDPKTGRILSLFGTAQDVTERRRAEDELRSLNAGLDERVRSRTADIERTLEDLEAFSYTASHDLRAPIGILQHHAKVLAEALIGKLAPAEAHALGRITDSVARMERLIQDLLVLGRLTKEELTISPVALDGLLDDLLDQNPRWKDAAVRVRRPLHAVKASAPLLTLAVTNLVGNALKFVAPDASPSVEVWSERTGAAVRLFVQDEGIGIDSDYHEKIFTPFLRLHTEEKYPGTGIGLAVVKKTIERMGGRVGVEAAPVRGSRFWLELPAALP